MDREQALLLPTPQLSVDGTDKRVEAVSTACEGQILVVTVLYVPFYLQKDEAQGTLSE